MSRDVGQRQSRGRRTAGCRRRRACGANADEVEPVRPGFERADHGRSDAQDVPCRELDDLVVEPGTTGAGDDDVGLLLLAMAVSDRHAGTWLVGEPADADLD